jgi:hypothetical protein
MRNLAQHRRETAGRTDFSFGWALVMVLELEDFVFYSQLLALQISDRLGVRRGSTDFVVDLVLQMRVLGAKCLDSILLRHRHLQSKWTEIEESYA